MSSLPKPIDDRIAAGIIFGLGLAGVLLNFTGALLTFRVTALRTSFGRLTAVHCFADGAILVIFTFWCSPRTLLFLGLYTHFGIALNRFSLLFLPWIYKEVFQRRTSWLILFNVLICTCHFCVYFGDGCDFYYNAETYFWEYADTPCGKAVAFWLDLSLGCAICITVLLLDIICVVKMRKSASVIGNSVTAREQKLRWGRQKRFLAQACCTGLLFVLMILSFQVVSRYVSGLWPSFISTSLVWEIAHLGDGIILFIFNRELRRALMHPKILLSFSTIHSTHTTTISSKGSSMREASINIPR